MSLPNMTRPDVAKGGRAQPPGTTLDEFLGGRISVLQPERGHRAGSDAVFLAAAVAAVEGSRVLDAGAGVGVAGLCLLARVPGIDVTAVEIDEKLCALAAANAARNDFGARFCVIAGDVTAKAEALLAAGLRREGYDEVMANPPFYREGTVRAAPNAGREAAHVMQEGALAAWVRFFATMTAPKGRLTLIHRPEALAELLPLIEGRFGAVTLYPLFAKAGGTATRIILRARKGSREGLALLPGLVLHEADGRYTAEAEAALREGKALELGG
jgi:tRNA1(Val) A37 N6-methylase TrmN6